MAHRLLFLSVLAAACAKSPDVPDTGGAADAGIVYADVVLNFTQAGEPQICSDGLPPCNEPPGEPCGPPEVLGPPDTTTFALEADGRIDLGFRCGAVVEVGGIDSPDVTIWATVPEGSQAIVLVSEDGMSYQSWDVMEDTNQQLDLGKVDRSYLRYIRIADTGGGGITIDAIEGI